MPRPARSRSQTRDACVTAALVVVAVAVYYQIPVPGRMRKDSWEIMFCLGVVVLGLLILLAARKLISAGENARLRALILLLTLTVLFFSWADQSVAALPGQFTELHDKTDALYFNISTLATVGFGDVHPTGQLARAAVTLQIVFNLVFLGAAVSLISGYFRTRARGRVGGKAPPGEA
jgi:voltage-gated potassium channel